MLFRLVFLFLVIINSASAQIKPKFGLRAGVNFSGMSGTHEIGDSSQFLDKYKMSPKIAVAAHVRLPFSKRFGLAAEVAFSQRGAYYEYAVDKSFLKVPSTGLLFEGHKREMGMNVINGYIEIPILFQAEIIDDRLLLEVGPSVGFLVSSRALGTLKYTDPDHTDKIMEYDLDYKFLKDDIGGFSGTATRTGKIDGTTITHPQTIGAYYFLEEKKGSFYNVIDFGVNFGLSYYFTQGLRIGTRGYVGLLDITNNSLDFNQRLLNDDKSLLPRADRDTNWGIQLFIGLQF